MVNIKIGWMYPNLLNLHGERGSVQALVQVGKDLGMDVEVVRIESFDDPIPFEDLDLLIFPPGEISTFQHIIPALKGQRDALNAYIAADGYILALGTSGLIFGKGIQREDGSKLEGLGILDMNATERRYVWGDDLHLRIQDTKQELAGSQIMMMDVQAANPFGQTIYGRGNDGTGAEGARYRNLIYTNCLGPLFVKNPWFAETILKNICLKKHLGIGPGKARTIASNSFESTLQFIKDKPPFNG